MTGTHIAIGYAAGLLVMAVGLTTDVPDAILFAISAAATGIVLTLLQR